jgi:transposase
VFPQGTRALLREVPGILRDPENGSLDSVCARFARLLVHIKELDRQGTDLEQPIPHWHKRNDHSRKLEKVPGIGPVTRQALVATRGDATAFQHGRQLAAWLGWVPRQQSTGGKPRLRGISKRGDISPRTLLIHGARAGERVKNRGQ